MTVSRRELAHSITNDRRGVVSRNDAERIMTAAVSEIETSQDPQAAFTSASRTISASQALVGRDRNATETLSDFRQQGQAAVRARLEELTGNKQIPASIERDFDSLLLGQYGLLEVEGPATFSNVNGNDKDGYSFNWSAGTKSGKAFGIPFEGGLILSDREVPKALLNTAVEEMKTYFDDYFASDMVSDGTTRAEVNEMRDGITIDHVMWANEEDPVGANSDYDFAFNMTNPTGSDHGFYVGLDANGTGMANSFN